MRDLISKSAAFLAANVGRCSTCMRLSLSSAAPFFSADRAGKGFTARITPRQRRDCPRAQSRLLLGVSSNAAFDTKRTAIALRVCGYTRQWLHRDQCATFA